MTLSKETEASILTTYREFLKEMNYNFQIIIINTKLNTDEYVDKYFCDHDIIENSKDKHLYNLYFEELKDSLKRNSVYEAKMYIALNSSLDIEDVERIFQKLTKIGCKVRRLNDENEIKKILYKMINKHY